MDFRKGYDMSKVRLAIQFNQMPPYDMQLGWIDLMDRALTQKTKDYIEHGSFDLRILAVLIKQSILEAKSEEQIDGLLWSKLHDTNLVTGLMGKIL